MGDTSAHQKGDAPSSAGTEASVLGTVPDPILCVSSSSALSFITSFSRRANTSVPLTSAGCSSK